MRIIPAWLREFVDIPADDRQLAEDLTSAGIAVESVEEEHGSTFYEMDLTTNRVDAMNHYGVAREASAIYNLALKPIEPKLPVVEPGPSALVAKGGPPSVGMTASEKTEFPIVIEDAKGCARYTARVIRKVKVGPSPEKVFKRLQLLGSRSINNAADATNYALNELGHPTHAFDLDLLEGGTIIVRRARAGETLKTLDGVDRKLTPEDLVIADANKPVALAGVMGGFDTMITERTKNVLIESAWFDPAIIRSMAKRHGMHTDASHRFERGADWGITPAACDRVAKLILESAGGEMHGEQIDEVARTPERVSIALRSSEVKRNLGIELAGDEISRILHRLGFDAKIQENLTSKTNAGVLTSKTEETNLTSKTSGRNLISKKMREDSAQQEGDPKVLPDEGTPGVPTAFTVQVPTWRLDVEREIDLLEELARIHGFNKFPNTLPAFVGAVVELPDERKNARVRETMLALGYDESISITFISEQDARTFVRTHSSKSGLNGAPEPLALANPLSEEAGYMRTSLLPGLLNMVGYNLNRGTTNVKVFEAGEVFEKLGDRHAECRHLGLVATGNALGGDLHAGAQAYSFFHMKGDIEQLLAAFQHKALYFDAIVPEYFHPGRAARAVMDGETVAFFGQLHPDQAAQRKLRQDVYLAEVMLDRVYEHSLREPRYQRISKFPAVERDFSFVFDNAVTFDRIKSAVSVLEIAELKELIPAEVFRGEKVGGGKYSALLHAGFQSKERTLRDDEVAQWSAQIVAAMEALGGTLRAQ